MSTRAVAPGLVHPIQHAAVTWNQVARVLDAESTFQARFEKIAHLGHQRKHHACRNQLRDPTLAMQKRRAQSGQSGRPDPAGQAGPSLARADRRCQLGPTQAPADQVGTGVGGPDYRDQPQRQGPVEIGAQPQEGQAGRPQICRAGAVPQDGRDLSQGSESVDEYQPLVATGLRTPTVTQRVSRSLTPKGSTTQSATLVSTDFWFYEADVVLLYDDDEDGYFYGVDLLFDADTFYDVADVYAVVYLSYEGGPWNEYAATEDFSIFGSSPNDEYVLVTELRSGYPTGEYDLLIELFDAFDGSFLASFGPQDTSELSFLPLEDFNRDAPGFDTPTGCCERCSRAFWPLRAAHGSLRQQLLRPSASRRESPDTQEPPTRTCRRAVQRRSGAPSRCSGWIPPIRMAREIRRPC